MTHAALIAEKKGGLQLSELVLLPFALMLALFRCFFGEELQWMKRQRRSRPMPKNWRQHYDELRLSEWSVAELTRAGLAQLLAGKPLDLEGIETSDPPEDWVCPMPASAFEMHRRIEAVLAFNADPEGRIRRLACRAVRRLAAAVASLAPLIAPATTTVTAVAAPALGPRIRAPPRPGPVPETRVPPNLPILSAGKWACVRKYPQGPLPVVAQHNAARTGALPRRHSAFGRIRQARCC